ncbi:hypothetical protein AALP_AAs44704U000100, partial [Arabis alpina]
PCHCVQLYGCIQALTQAENFSLEKSDSNKNTKHSSSTASKIRDVETLSNGMEEPITAKWDK